MHRRLRLLPVLVGASALLFGAKLADLWLAIGLAPVAVASAQSAAPLPPAEPSTAPAAAPPARAAERDAAQFSPQEIQLLQSLAQRRDELDKRSGDIDQREALLAAAEQRIDDKIAKLKEMEQAIDESFKKQDQQEDAKVESLVKIYETMKPQEAARIFEQLDLPVLLQVVERMKERKTAPILAAMNPGKAKALTLALAERHPSPELK